MMDPTWGSWCGCSNTADSTGRQSSLGEKPRNWYEGSQMVIPSSGRTSRRRKRAGSGAGERESQSQSSRVDMTD